MRKKDTFEMEKELPKKHRLFRSHHLILGAAASLYATALFTTQVHA